MGIKDYAKLVRQNPCDTRALLRLAEHHVKISQMEKACELYARAGDVYVKQGFARRAISSFLHALECARAQMATQDRVGPIARNLARLYIAEKLPRDAVVTLDSAAKFLAERGADVAAVALLEQRVAIDDAEIACVRLAEALFRLGETSRAADQLAGVFRRLHAVGQREDAIEVAERLLHHRRDTGIARTLAELYLARNHHGDPFLALAKLRSCCEENPAHVPTLELLARAFDQAKHPEKAARVRGEIAKIAGPTPRAPSTGRRAPAPSGVDRIERRRDREAPLSSRRSLEDTGSRVDAGWDDLMAPSGRPVPAAPDKRIDIGRPSFWAVAEDGPAEDSVVDVSVAELMVEEGALDGAQSSLLETALECVDSLIAQGRLDEASLLVARHLGLRPKNPLLLERRSELEQLKADQPDPRASSIRCIDSQPSLATSLRRLA